jgi:hypothetical protein
MFARFFYYCLSVFLLVSLAASFSVGLPVLLPTKRGCEGDWLIFITHKKIITKREILKLL